MKLCVWLDMKFIELAQKVYIYLAIVGLNKCFETGDEIWLSIENLTVAICQFSPWMRKDEGIVQN